MPPVRSLLFFAGIASSALLGWSALLPALALMPISAAVHRRAASLVQGWWFSVASFLLEHVFGTQMVFYGDELSGADYPLIVSNHRTRIDWMYLWRLCLRLGRLGSLRIVLKESLKFVPIVGYAMQSFMFVFLSRKWAADREYMQRVLEYLTRTAGERVTMLCFPEGTDLSESNVEKSRAFAAEHGLPQFRYVLNPRTTGFVNVAKWLPLTCVYDVTMAYDDFAAGERPSEGSLVSGRTPRRVHFLVRKYAVADLPMDDDEALAAWMHDRFAEKEALLEAFYERDEPFPDPLPRAGHVGLVYAAAIGAFVFGWGVFAYLLASYRLVWLFIAAMALSTVVACKVFGGVDRMELALHSGSGGSASKKAD